MDVVTKPAQLRNVILLAMLTWLLVASAYHSAVNPAAGITGVDFQVFYNAADRLNRGLALYQTDHDLYVYSPLFALLLRPLAHLPYETALKSWFFINALAVVLSVLVYARAARLTLCDAVPIGLMLLVSFRFWPATMNFGLGQANFLLLALLTGMYWADSRNKSFSFALLIIAGALIKVWMLGLILHLLLKREWRPALLSIGGYTAAMGVLFSVVGWREWPLFVQAGVAAANKIAAHRVRQSILGFADLHFHANPLIQPLWSSSLLSSLFVLLCVAGIGLMLFSVWRRMPSAARSPDLYQTSYRDRLNFGLVIVSVLLLLPSFEDEYIILCLPLLWTLLLAPAADERHRLRWQLPCSFLVYLVLNRGWPVYPPIPAADQHGLHSLLVSMDFFGVSALWFLTCFALRELGLARQTAKEPFAENAEENNAGENAEAAGIVTVR